jgi:hypothetical protein
MEGRFSGSFSFGPNQISDTIDETYVKSYKVYFADANHTKIGASVATVSVENSRVAISTCGCSATQHAVTLSMVDIPSNATGFMVVIVDVYDFEMPVGTYIGGLHDVYTTTTTTTTTSSMTSTSTTTTTSVSTTTTTVTLKPVVSGALRRGVNWTFAVFVASLIAALGLPA